MRSGRAAGGFREIVDRLDQLRIRRIGVDVENKHAAGIEPGQPKLAPVVGESAMVRFVASRNGRAVDDLAVGGRAGSYINRYQLVRAVAHPFYAQGPDLNKFLLTIDARQVRRRTRFVGAGSAKDEK